MIGRGRGEFMDRGLSLLIRLMRESWVFMIHPEKEKQVKTFQKESDQEESFFFFDGTND
jgi:hypothetical protein